jgi:DNA repair exonuclease SbcCD ATPase subunit
MLKAVRENHNKSKKEIKTRENTIKNTEKMVKQLDKLRASHNKFKKEIKIRENTIKNAEKARNVIRKYKGELATPLRMEINTKLREAMRFHSVAINRENRAINMLKMSLNTIEGQYVNIVRRAIENGIIAKP